MKKWPAGFVDADWINYAVAQHGCAGAPELDCGLDLPGTSRGVHLLCSLDGVDSDRIAIYGLSQGGFNAFYMPAMDTRIKASVCSGYLNSRFIKLVGPGRRAMTFLDSREGDKFFPDVIRCFSDSDIVSLIARRSFAVEAGKKESSVDFKRSVEEFEQAKVHYDKLDIPERIEFIGHERGHVSDTVRALDFLQEQLEKTQ